MIRGMIREDPTLFNAELLERFRLAGYPQGDSRRAAALEELTEGAYSEGWGSEIVEIGLRVLEYEAGNWPGYGDPALIVPYMELEERHMLADAPQSVTVPMLAGAIGILNPDGALQGLPSDIWEAIADLIEQFAEHHTDERRRQLASEAPSRVTEQQRRTYLSLRNNWVSVEEAASMAGISLTHGSEPELAILERLTNRGQERMRAAATSGMTWQRFENLAMGAFASSDVGDLPDYVLEVALREMLQLCGFPEGELALEAGPLPWPRPMLARAREALSALRQYLIRVDARPSPAAEDVPPVFGEGTVELVENGPVEGDEGPRPLTVDDVAEMIQDRAGLALDGDAGEAPEPQVPGPPPAPPPPPPLVGEVEGAVIEMLDDDGNVVEPTPEAPPEPPPPEPRLYTGAEMAAMGSAESTANMMAVMSRAASRGTVLDAGGRAVPIGTDAAFAWVGMQCVDAIVRILPAQIRDGELPASLSRFSAFTLGLLLVAEQMGHPTHRLGRQHGRRLNAKFPCLTARGGQNAPICSVGIWALKVLERGAALGGPMLAFASERKLIEAAEEDPGGFMGELANLAVAARSLQPPAAENGKKLAALRQFFNNN